MFYNNTNDISVVVDHIDDDRYLPIEVVVLLGMLLGIVSLIVTINAVKSRNLTSLSFPASSGEHIIDNRTTIVLGDDSAKSPSPTCPLGDSYPNSVARWCDGITMYASKFDLPPELIAAVILQESGGNPDAYSHSGAVGLMQVMPRDGIAAQFICANGPCFSNRPSTQELLDPTFNIHFGVRLLNSLVKRYGNYRDALKAYGPMDVGYTYADRVLNIYASHK